MKTYKPKRHIHERIHTNRGRDTWTHKPTRHIQIKTHMKILIPTRFTEEKTHTDQQDIYIGRDT